MFWLGIIVFYRWKSLTDIDFNPVPPLMETGYFICDDILPHTISLLHTCLSVSFLYLSIPTVMSTNNHATVCGCVHVRDIINPLLLLLLTWSNIICFFVYMQACWNHTAAVRLWYLQCVWTAVLIRSRDRWWPSPSSMDLQIDTLTHLITILTVLTTVTHSGFVADRSWSCFCTRQTFIMSTNQKGWWWWGWRWWWWHRYELWWSWRGWRLGQQARRAIHVQTSHGLGCRGDSARMLADGQRHARVL